MTDNRNTIFAVILSGLVLLGWQYFYNIPQMEKQRAAQQAQTQQAQTTTPAQNAGNSAAPQASTPAPSNAPANAQTGSAAPVSRETAMAAAPRVKIESPRVVGSISLKGARIDDLSLLQFRETVDPKSPAIVLYSPSGTENPYYAEFGWVAASGASVKVPDQNTIWQEETPGNLTPSHPVTLKYENGDGLTFRRTIAIDDHYLFTIKDDVTNVGSAPVTLYPFALISRHGTPQVSGYYILHEGLIGYLGDQGLQEYTYKKIDEAKAVSFKVTDGWLGITDKYWASALLPDTAAGTLFLQSRRQCPHLSDRLSTGRADDCDRRYRQRPYTAICRRQGSRRCRHQFSGRRARRIQQAA
jgi:YidC/Oxa1 family membrane protein insertase